VEAQQMQAQQAVVKLATLNEARQKIEMQMERSADALVSNAALQETKGEENAKSQKLESEKAEKAMKELESEKAEITRATKKRAQLANEAKLRAEGAKQRAMQAREMAQQAKELDELRKQQTRLEEQRVTLEERQKAHGEGVKKTAGRTVRATKKMNDDVKRLLRLMGCPVVEAPGEAEVGAYLHASPLVHVTCF
jgi:hypothetical protein